MGRYMLFYSYEDVVRINGLLSNIPVEVSEELRGWNWSKYPIIPPSRTQIAVSDIFNGFCDSLRFIYIKRVLREEQAQVKKLEEGTLIHKAFGEAIATAKSLILELGEGYKEFRKRFMDRLSNRVDTLINTLRLINEEKGRYKGILEELFDEAANIYAAAYSKAVTSSYYLSPDGLISLVVPIISEFPIDGSLIGFSRNIRADALLPPNVLIEIKTRKPKHQHELQLAAYALAFESIYRVPVNHSIIIYLDIDSRRGIIKRSEKIITISDQLRSEVIEKRDLAYKIVDEGYDPGLPDKCDIYCPYLKVCKVDEDSIG
jgi:CRISPR-associated protein Csa1